MKSLPLPSLLVCPGRMKALFLQLHILDENAVDSGKTVTQVVLEQSMACGPIQHGSKVHYLWTSVSKSEMKQSCLSLFAVVQTCLSRLSSEFRGLQFDMAAFDLFSMHQHVLNGDMQTYEILTNTRVRRLLKQGVRCSDPDAVLRAFWAAAYELLQVHAPELGANPKFDNRAAWRSILKSPSELTSLVNFYLGFLDGSNVCERSLGRMSKQKLQHLGPLEENGVSLTMFLELKEDGPQAETELLSRSLVPDPFGRGDVVHLKATEFLLDCGKIWKTCYGSRFRLYKRRSDVGVERTKKPKTLASLRRGQTAAANSLLQRAEQRSGETDTILRGLKRKHLPSIVPLEQNPKFNQKLADLRKQDKQRNESHLALAQARKQRPRGNPFKVGEVRKACLLTKPAGVGVNSDGRAKAYLARSVLNIVDIRPQGGRLVQKNSRQSLNVWRPTSDSSPQDVLAKVHNCHLVFLEKDSHFQTLPQQAVLLGLIQSELF